MKGLLILISSFFLVSCDILLDEALDCFNNDEPQFDQDSFPDATLNQVYAETITASIKNNSANNYYNYAFGIEGDLPRGLYESQGLGSRTLRIWGTPTELGSHSFKIIVIVTEYGSYLNYEQSIKSYNNDTNLCRNRHEQKFELKVVME